MRITPDSVLKTTLIVLGLLLVISVQPVAADIVTFDFTGRLTVVDPLNNVVGGGTDGYTPISAQLTMDTGFVSGGSFNIDDFVGTSTLDINVNDFFLGAPARIHDVSLSYGGGTTLNGSLLGDWNGNNDMPFFIEWDATGLASAVLFGLQVGDTLSGNQMSRGGVVVIPDLGSATPYADLLDYTNFPDFTPQGPAPMAATSSSLGLTDGPFVGLRVLIDIGSGNSMTVASISTVPIPAAAWLFGSGLLGLVGIARRKKA